MASAGETSERDFLDFVVSCVGALLSLFGGVFVLFCSWPAQSYLSTYAGLFWH
jgi:hypothetical protein